MEVEEENKNVNKYNDIIKLEEMVNSVQNNYKVIKNILQSYYERKKYSNNKYSVYILKSTNNRFTIDSKKYYKIKVC